MPITDEMAQVSISTAGEIIKTSTEKALEILKALARVIFSKDKRSAAKESLEEKISQKNRKYLDRHSGEVQLDRFKKSKHIRKIARNILR